MVGYADHRFSALDPVSGIELSRHIEFHHGHLLAEIQRLAGRASSGHDPLVIVIVTSRLRHVCSAFTEGMARETGAEPGARVCYLGAGHALCGIAGQDWVAALYLLSVLSVRGKVEALIFGADLIFVRLCALLPFYFLAPEKLLKKPNHKRGHDDQR